MATVNVTNFQEFIEAVAVVGDTVTCPVNAVWDMNEIDPLNTIGTITINANVVGNNTEIRNFRGRCACRWEIVIDALHFINCLCESENKGFLGASSPFTVQNCKISCELSASAQLFSDNASFLRCALTISAEISRSGKERIFSGSQTRSRYCRVKINAPNAVDLGNYGYWNFSDSEFIVSAPLSTFLTGRMQRCTVRGDLPLVASTEVGLTNNFSVIVAPSFTATNKNFKTVTDEQLKDVDYLASIGFVIGE
jgi:hypothetical protein